MQENLRGETIGRRRRPRWYRGRICQWSNVQQSPRGKKPGSYPRQTGSLDYRKQACHVTHTELSRGNVSARTKLSPTARSIVSENSRFAEWNCSSGASQNQIRRHSISVIIVRCGSLPRQESVGSFFPARRLRPSTSRASILSAKEYSLRH